MDDLRRNFVRTELQQMANWTQHLGRDLTDPFSREILGRLAADLDSLARHHHIQLTNASMRWWDAS